MKREVTICGLLTFTHMENHVRLFLIFINNSACMRSIIALFLLVSAFNLDAQTYLPVGIGSYAQRPLLADQGFLNDSTPGKKWFVSRYTGISTSFIFSKFGSATVLSVPLGVQLNRKLTNNLYAF